MFSSFRFITFCVLFLFVVPTVSYGQGAPNGGTGIGLKPATVEVSLAPGEVKQFTVVISNVSGVDQLYYLYKRDIVGVKDGGVPVFADNDIEKTSLELSQWITLEAQTLSIPKGEERPLSFIISIPENAPTCDHFGGIFVSAEPPELRESGAAVGYEVGNIISVRVAGECTVEASIRQFSTDNYIYGKSEVNFSARIQNEGNTLVRPTGPLEINNMFGKQVAKLSFNNEQAGVYPGATREFTMSWLGDGPGFGRYEAILSPVYGEDGIKKTMSSTATFWVLPMNIILPAFGVLAFILLVTYISIRLYIRNKLADYGTVGSTRRLVRRRKDSSSSVLLLIFTVMASVTAVFMIILVFLFA